MIDLFDIADTSSPALFWNKGCTVLLIRAVICRDSRAL